VTTQGSYKSRPLIWEDEAPADSRFRRVQQGVPPTGRALPGMPLEMSDPDSDDPSRPDWGRTGPGRFGSQGDNAPRGPWWRPASTAGRVFLALGALVVLGALGTGIFLLKTYLERDARFRIAGAGNIQATGLTQVSRAEMLPVFGEDIGRNVFFVPLAERRRELEAIPWVERATVMRLLPDQIRIQVVERQPVAFVRQDQQIGLVDASGVLLSMPTATMAQHHYSFPVVTGIDPRDPLPSRTARMAVYGRLMAELDANNQHLSQQISEIDLTDQEDARVLMPEQGDDILAHFGEDRFLERYQRYKAHIAEWRQQYPKLAAVDLRYDQQVVLEMAPGAGTAQATVGDPAAASTDSAKTSPAEPAQSAKPAAAKPPSGKPGLAVKNGKPAAKPAGKQSVKARTVSAKDKAAQDKKKRAQAKRAALNLNRNKPSAATRTAESD
jgi:cell division protein FtsQ